MRDGVKLHTIYYFPREGGSGENKKYPVILTRTCYPGNDRIHRAYGEGLARRGYVYVYQYCRGREQSEGKWEPNINERNDGIDTMDYLVEQPWCEILGYWGHSYTSMTGWAFADAAGGESCRNVSGGLWNGPFCISLREGLLPPRYPDRMVDGKCGKTSEC